MTDLTKLNMIVGLIVGLSVYAALQVDGAIMQATLIGSLLIAFALLIALDVVTGDTTARTDNDD